MADPPNVERMLLMDEPYGTLREIAMTHDDHADKQHRLERTDPDERADAMRMELLKLRADLDQAQREFDGNRAAQLLAANEQLLLTALKAETIAETAKAKLTELIRLTQHDPLTGTPNRALMLDRLQNAIALAKRHEAHFAVLFVDIDRFKHINDAHGHATGDEVLQQVARRLEKAVRDSDTVSRHSGDEFVVLLSEISQASDAAAVAKNMLTAIAGSADEHVPPFPVSVSIGIAIYPEDGVDVGSLIDHADAAMYRAKGEGGGRFVFHSADFPHEASARMSGALDEQRRGAEQALVRDLRNANEKLVLSSLAAHESEAEATQARLGQIKFLATVAHELRNPLAPIRMATEMLNHARNDEKQLEHLQQIIKRQVANMARIVGDLLEGSRVDIGKFRLASTPVDLVDVLNLALDSFGPALDAKRQQLARHLPNRPLVVNGDPVRLAQIFQNLLDNANKYTPEGGSVVLTATVVQHTVEIDVSDNGIGITPEALPHVFDLFAQDPRAAARGGGLGVGLAVVRELVEAHGGSIEAHSAGPDLGSRFVVTLPLASG